MNHDTQPTADPIDELIKLIAEYIVADALAERDTQHTADHTDEPE